MKNDLTTEQLLQPVTLTLPLGAVLRLAEFDARPLHTIPPVGRYDILPDCLPKLGHPWIGLPGEDIKDGIYTGLTLHDNAPMALVLLPGDEERRWSNADQWAKDRGGVLPSRHDMLVLLKNVKSEFKPEWYWTSEEYTGNTDYAWVAHFNYGNQDWYRKSDGCRCRAVRRVAI